MADNIEARMSFVIEQRAQFTTDIQLLKERQEATQVEIDGMKVRIRQLADVTMSLARHAEEADRRLAETDRPIAETDQPLRELGEQTDRRLDALIDAVDRHVRRNGPPQESRG